MKLFDKFKNALNNITKSKSPPEQPKREKKLSAKEQANKDGRPWVQVINVELDEENPGAGAFELDWNDKFVANLIRSGYQGKTDQDIVDNWFQDVCRHVVLETYQQEQADPDKRTQPAVQRRDLGDGRSEFS